MNAYIIWFSFVKDVSSCSPDQQTCTLNSSSPLRFQTPFASVFLVSSSAQIQTPIYAQHQAKMLLQLPEELVVFIIDLLSTRDLKELACVNKVLSTRCQRSLYRHVVFTYHGHQNHQTAQPLRTFIRIILYWPDRAEFVKTLCFYAHREGFQ